jgi:glucose/arabinose dehydrogenase
MKAAPTHFTALFLLVFLWQNAQAQPYLGMSLLTTVSTPVDIAHAGDGSNRLFLVEKAGRIRIYDLNSSTLLPGYFLDIDAQVSDSGERGLLGLAFHPDYPSNGYFYVNYTDNAGDTHISRFTVSADPNVANAGSELDILTVGQPYSNHNGGDLEFGPDGYLYIPLGDGGDGGDPGNRSQNPQELLGKLLRIDVNSSSGGNNYAIPPDNPFVGVQTPVDYRDEIWALGLRNPWRFSFDRQTGDIWIADVGQGAWEEVNFQAASSNGGENYGWRCYEGNHSYNTSGCGPASNYDFPIFEYPHDPNTGGNSITGGYVYRGNDFPELQGWYIVADFTSDNFWLIRPDGIGGWDWHLITDVPSVNDVVTFGEDEAGEMYVADLGGQVYAISADYDPCPLDSTLTLNPYHMDTVSASNNLTTEGEVTIPNSAEVVFTAGTGITLAANFTSQLGAELTAYIEDCSSNFTAPATGLQGHIDPNPSLGTHPKRAAFSIYDGRGMLIKEGNFHKHKLEDQLANEPAGVYFIAIESEQETIRRKVVK